MTYRKVRINNLHWIAIHRICKDKLKMNIHHSIDILLKKVRLSVVRQLYLWGQKSFVAKAGKVQYVNTKYKVDEMHLGVGLLSACFALVWCHPHEVSRGKWLSLIVPR
ncbi:hypothetical protein AB9P05_00920 [Roseivirga sp. BDSF3-8]|uniref:hypothetical protein n=1 Tax=Roseivirga sp. BDSF3-8 TaxID=3241598 RepID=UPI003532037D